MKIIVPVDYSFSVVILEKRADCLFFSFRATITALVHQRQSRELDGRTWLKVLNGDTRLRFTRAFRMLEQCTISETGVHLRGMLIPF